MNRLKLLPILFVAALGLPMVANTANTANPPSEKCLVQLKKSDFNERDYKNWLKDMGERLAEARIKLGETEQAPVTQAELSRRLKVSSPFIGGLERGYYAIPFARLKEFAKVLRVDAYSLYALDTLELDIAELQRRRGEEASPKPDKPKPSKPKPEQIPEPILSVDEIDALANLHDLPLDSIVEELIRRGYAVRLKRQ